MRSLRITRPQLVVVLSLLFVVAVTVTAFMLVPKFTTGERSIGANIKVESTKYKDDLKAQVVSPSALPLVPDVMQPVSKFYEIGPSGPLPAPMQVRLPLLNPIQPSDEYIVTIYTAQNAGGPWDEALPTTLAPDGKSVVGTATHLSFFVAVKTFIGKLVGGVVSAAKSMLGVAKMAFDTATSDVFKQAEQPACDATDRARAGGYGVSSDRGVSDKDDTFLWCFGMEGEERILQVTNNRPYPLRFDHPGFTVADAGPAIQFRLAQVSRAVSGRETVVFPGETVKFAVDLPTQGGEAHIQAYFDGLAQSLYSLETGLRTALLFFTNFGAGSGNAVNGAIVNKLSTADRLAELLDNADCASQVVEQKLDVSKLFGACLDADELTGLFGKAAAAVLLPIFAVAPLIQYFRSQLSALGSQFTGTDRQRVTVVRANIAELCPGGEANCYGIRQADVDGDGALDSVSLVFDTEYQDARQFGVRVVYSTGEVAKGYFGFPNPDEPGTLNVLPADPVVMKFSFQGFADINGEPGLEIFGRVFVNGDWYIRPLEYKGDKEADVEQLYFDGLTFDFSSGLNTPFGISTFFSSPTSVDGGFRCGKSADGQPQIIVWQVSVFDRPGTSDDEWSFQQVTYQPPDGNRAWEQQPNLYKDGGGPLKDRSAPKREAKAQRAKGSCEGLGALPLR